MPTIARATIKSYDASTHSATVQIAGSLAVWLDAVPVSDGISPADVVAGRECGVIFFTEDNPGDAAIVTIHNAVPTGWGGGGGTKIQDADASTYVDVEQSADEDKVRMAVGGTLRYLLQTASPHHTLTGDVYLKGDAALGFAGAGTGQVVIDGPTSFASGGALGVGGVLLNNAVVYIADPGVTGAGGAATRLAGLMVDNGLAGSVAANRIYGIGGNAQANASTVTYIAGLRFQAALAVSGATVSALKGCEVVVVTSGAGTSTVATATGYDLTSMITGFTSGGIATFQGYNCPDPASAKIATVYAFRVAGQTNYTTNAYPFYDAGTSDTSGKAGNVFRTNTQFGSTTLAFGGGDGVIGLAYAATNPTASPSGGVVIYAQSSTGDVKIRGAGGAIVKLPTGGATNVTGSRGGNAALANLLTALAGLGLIVDGTT